MVKEYTKEGELKRLQAQMKRIMEQLEEIKIAQQERREYIEKQGRENTQGLINKELLLD